MPTNERLVQAAMIASGLVFCWLSMQGVHEFGHVLGAVASGGTVQDVVLHPLRISRTDVQPNPHPALVVWAGPLTGVALPALAWGAIHVLKSGLEYLVRCWCGFCLIANGAYIGTGAFMPVGDAQTMLQTGSPAWLLLLFGLVTIPAGLWCWHNQGRSFGLGPEAAPVDRRHTFVISALLVAIVIVEIVAG